ncbi:MAG: hypothetical protein ACR2HR_17125 [Euzebya sp.]
MDIGTWVKVSSFVGLLAAIEEDGTLVLFNPGDRQMLRATAGTAQALPSDWVDVTITHRVQVPHGLGEDALRRWLAALIDPVLRQRARESLVEQGLDTGAFDSEPSVDVRQKPAD